MSAVKGVNYTLACDPTGANILAPGLKGGRVRAMIDTYEASTLAENSTIAVGKLPPGAKVVGVILSTDALGTSTTISIGDAGSATRLLGATSTASAVSGAVAIPVGGLGYEYTAETEIILTLGGAAGTGTINVIILYVTD